MRTGKNTRIAFSVIAAAMLVFSCVFMTGCNSGSNSGASGTNTGTAKPVRNGFNEKTNKSVTMGSYSFSIPDYYVEKNTSSSSDTSKTYQIKNDSSVIGVLYLACKQFTGSDADKIKNASASQIDTYLKEVEEGIQNNATSVSNKRNTSVAGYSAKTADFVMDASGETLTGRYVIFIDTSTAETVSLMFGTTENADYDYSSDYQKIIDSISKASSSSGSSGNSANSNEVSPDFKATMDSYEAFCDEYVEFMKEYMENPTNTKLLSKYSNMLSQYSKMMSALNAIDKDSLSTADAAYYLEVSSRITKKLAEVL